MELHFICKHGDRHSRIEGQTYETGNWYINDDTANEFIGGRIYLHEKQDEPAWHGGTIKSWRVSPEDSTRKVFTYEVDAPFRIKCKNGWGQEKAIIRSSKVEAGASNAE